MRPPARYVLGTSVVLAAVAIVAATLFIWSGRYDFAADDPHSPLVLSLIEQARERSIALRAATVTVPDLSDPKRALQGAGNYDAMCASCHLAPGIRDSELSRGLYPAPPNLSTEKVAMAKAFWVIKHGVKASGMPAWGKSMSDEYVWNMVAFLQQLPHLDEREYRTMVAESEGHHHDHGEPAHHDELDEPGSSHADSIKTTPHDGHASPSAGASEPDVAKDGTAHQHAKRSGTHIH